MFRVKNERFSRFFRAVPAIFSSRRARPGFFFEKKRKNDRFVLS